MRPRPEGAEKSAGGGRSVELSRRRDMLVVALTFVTGCADAIGFLALGGAFASVMTGNLVLLGLSAGSAREQLALTSGCAIASFIAGLLVGARIAGAPQPGDPVWPRQVTRALLLELAVYASFAAAWELTADHRSPAVKLGMLMTSAIALGLQSSAIQRFGVPGLSSTYLTGTLTSLIGGVAARHPWHQLRLKANTLLALVIGAAAGVVIAERADRTAPLLLLFPLAGVAVIGARIPTPTAPGAALPAQEAASATTDSNA